MSIIPPNIPLDREALAAASRTPAYKKVARVSGEQSAVNAKAPNPSIAPVLIPKERYTSREFMQREWDHLWSKVWLLGGLLQDLQEAGDYICTDIGRESVIIVRQADGSLRAFPNVCLHRGRKLRESICAPSSTPCATAGGGGGRWWGWNRVWPWCG